MVLRDVPPAGGLTGPAHTDLYCHAPPRVEQIAAGSKEGKYLRLRGRGRRAQGDDNM